MSNDQFNGLIPCSLCLVWRGDEILLGRKQKKLVRKCWNGYGGRQDPGEPIRKTAARELLEETQGKNGDAGILVDPNELERKAVLYFHNENEDGSTFTVRVEVFYALNWAGEARENDEMKCPTFFHKENLPFEEMAPGDQYWLEPVLAGKQVIAHIYYSPGQKKLRGVPEIKIVEDLNLLEPED